MTTPILLAHGLEGSPEGTKAQALRTLGQPFFCPDGRNKNLAERVELLRPHLDLTEKTLLVGSSYGGLVALYLACAHTERVCALLLCAPALHHREDPIRVLPTLPSSIPCTIIHGTKDRLIPSSISVDFAKQNPHVELLLVDDNHRLSGSTKLIVDTARRLRSSPQ